MSKYLVTEKYMWLRVVEYVTVRRLLHFLTNLTSVWQKHMILSKPLDVDSDFRFQSAWRFLSELLYRGENVHLPPIFVCAGTSRRKMSLLSARLAASVARNLPKTIPQVNTTVFKANLCEFECLCSNTFEYVMRLDFAEKCDITRPSSDNVLPGFLYWSLILAIFKLQLELTSVLFD